MNIRRFHLFFFAICIGGLVGLDAVSVVALEELFRKSGDYPVGDAPGSLSLNDFDGDGMLDIAVANYLSNDLSILLNRGEGTFSEDARYAVGDAPMSVWTDDFDGDGHIDCAVANWQKLYAGDVSVFLNRGDGTFSDSTNYGGGPTNGPLSLFGADLDGDGDVDLAAGRDTEVQILWNDGRGAFPDTTALDTSVDLLFMWLTAICGGDLDGDGDVDLVASHGLLGPTSGSTIVYLFFNEGDHHFSTAFMRRKGGGDITDFCVGDLDGDGDLDLIQVYIGNNPPSFFLFFNQGDAIFLDPVMPEIGLGLLSVWGADFDRDGDIDIATIAVEGYPWGLPACYLMVLLNDGKGVLSKAGVYEAGERAWCVRGGDVDGDGDSDLVVANSGGDDVSVFLNVFSDKRMSDVGLSRENDSRSMPRAVVLHQNHPNPFNVLTTIAYEVDTHEEVMLSIHTVEGQLVREWRSRNVGRGYRSVVWDGRDRKGSLVSSGIYFYTLQVGTFKQTKRMLLLR